MFAILIILHLAAAAVLILVVLLQSGKAGDLASTFGGATSQTAFGARGSATVLTRATTTCAILFMITSLGLSIMYSSSNNTSVMDGVNPPAATTPAEPAAAPAEQPKSETPTPAPTPTADDSGANNSTSQQ